MTQQAIALTIAATAGGWLLWRLAAALRGVLRPDRQSGCGKCGFAQPTGRTTTDEARRAAGIMPLHDRRTAVIRRPSPPRA